jgi:hypothetical protein
MDELTCPIWITRADSVISVGDSKVIDSPRAGGKYKITNTALALINDLKAKETTKITNWLVEQRMLGFEIPTLNSESLTIAKGFRLFSVSEMVDRALIWLSENVDGLGKHVPLGTHIPNYMGYEVLASYTQSLSAASGSSATHEVIELLEFSIEEGWVTSDPERKKNEGGFFSLTFRGHQRAESLKNKQASGRQAFVAMWFSPTMD